MTIWLNVQDFPGETGFYELSYTSEIWPAIENNDNELKYYHSYICLYSCIGDTGRREFSGRCCGLPFSFMGPQREREL